MSPESMLALEDAPAKGGSQTEKMERGVRLRIWGALVLWALGATLGSGTIASTARALGFALEILGVGWLVAALPPRSAAAFALQFSIALAALHGLGAAITRLYALAFAGAHAAPFAAVPAYVLLRAFGAPVSLDGGTIHLQSMRDLESFPVTWEMLALLPALLLASGAALFIACARARRPWRSLVMVSLALAMALAVRFALLVLAHDELMLHVDYDSEFDFVSLFWSPVAMIVTWLPIAAWLEICVPIELPAQLARTRAAPTASRSSLVRIVPIFAAGVACLTFATLFHDPGVLKQGRVLLDEGHSDWERVDRAYDTEWYGPDSGYNYSCIFDYLSRFYDVSRSRDELTAAALERHDVLILKIPTRKFAPGEVEAIVAWVRRGGGLYLIGDHTNVFGSGVYLNQVAEPLGFRFRSDCLFDIRHKFDQVYRRSRWLPHPVVRHLPAFQFATSCSIEPTAWPYEPVILSGGLKALPIDYSSSNFYPPVLDDPTMEFGFFLQMIGREVGRGRVLGFTDSTVFSNFAAFHPGKAELLISSIDWLMRRNRWRGANAAACVAGVVLIGLAALQWRRGAPAATSRGLAALLGAGLLAAAVCVAGLEALDRSVYAASSERRSLHRVVFSSTHSAMQAPSMTPENLTQEFAIFFQWVQRLGYFPTYAPPSWRTDDATSLCVLIEPIAKPSQEELRRITEYVRNGGRLLVVDGPHNFRSRAHDWLQPFGLECRHIRPVQVSALVDRSGRELYRADAVPSWTVRGGIPLLADGTTREVVGATARFGNGSVTCLGLSELFADEHMGRDQGNLPDPELRRLYDIGFRLIRGLVEGKPPESMF